MLGAPVISFFTSFKYPVMIEDDDVDMLEGVLQKCNLSDGFYLLLNSPGGDGLAAERIINICRSHSKTDEYKVIVPGKAKSAATMICLGASEIIMRKTAELGPVDPQIVLENKRFSVYNLVKSYKELFKKAVAEDGNLEPYLQQLDKYDAREIEEYKSACSLSRDIVIKALKTGMLHTMDKSEIEEYIEIFLNPEEVKVHGRPIYADDVEICGLNVDTKDSEDEFWDIIYELYYRLNTAVSNNHITKLIESEDYSFQASIKFE